MFNSSENVHQVPTFFLKKISGKSKTFSGNGGNNLVLGLRGSLLIFPILVSLIQNALTRVLEGESWPWTHQWACWKLFYGSNKSKKLSRLFLPFYNKLFQAGDRIAFYDNTSIREGSFLCSSQSHKLRHVVPPLKFPFDSYWEPVKNHWSVLKIFSHIFFKLRRSWSNSARQITFRLKISTFSPL